MGDVMVILLPVGILAAVLWGLSTAFRPRDGGMSDADRYQRDLAVQSAAHYAEQVRVAEALQAQIDAATLPSQNSRYAGGSTQHGPAGTMAPPASPLAAQMDPQLLMQLRSMVSGGQKIQATRLVRQTTNTDLLTAKQFIDRL